MRAVLVVLVVGCASPPPPRPLPAVADEQEARHDQPSSAAEPAPRYVVVPQPALPPGPPNPRPAGCDHPRAECTERVLQPFVSVRARVVDGTEREVLRRVHILRDDLAACYLEAHEQDRCRVGLLRVHARVWHSSTAVAGGGDDPILACVQGVLERAELGRALEGDSARLAIDLTLRPLSLAWRVGYGDIHGLDPAVPMYAPCDAHDANPH
jgi:hypothetical protein